MDDEQTAQAAKETLMNDTKGKIDTLFDHVINERTTLGVRVNTAEKIKEFNDENIVNLKAILSQDQDTDVVEKFIELKSAEMIYQASIQVGAKLIQPYNIRLYKIIGRLIWKYYLKKAYQDLKIINTLM